MVGLQYGDGQLQLSGDQGPDCPPTVWSLIVEETDASSLFRGSGATLALLL
jgi:hypothetical protein